MRKYVRLIRSITGWFIVACGAGLILSIFPDIYFYVFENGQAGMPVYSDHLAVTKSQIARYVIYGSCIMLVGYIITPERKYQYSDGELADIEPTQDESSQISPSRKAG